MADLIQIKAGDNPTEPLAERELGYKASEEALYIGYKGKNVKLAGKIASQALLAEESDISAVISAYNALISALKASGIMKEG